ncbi:MAG: hypothetical protein MI702_12835 [Chlorobiales bacterium]|nr:hypothetical protein [Chlorobiales bacterium]
MISKQQVSDWINSWIKQLKNRISKTSRLFLFTVVLPTLVAVFYFGLIKSDIYISESHFVIRSPERQIQTGLGAIFQGAGFSRSQDDAHNVHDFMLSRDALQNINAEIDLRKAFNRREVDLFSRFNPLGIDNSFEALFRYYRKRIAIELNNTSTISILQVRTFNTEDSYHINEMLLQMGEEFINRLNERSRQDMIRFAKSEVNIAAQKAKKAAKDLSDFRNKHGVFDPERQSALQLKQITKLQNELLATKVQLGQVRDFTPESPRIPSLKKRIEILRSEIENEMAKVAGGGHRSLTGKAVEYELLMIERAFADKQFAAAMVSLEQARSDAQRQQLYLERIVQPNKPDIAIEPRRIKSILTTFILGLIIWGIVTMFVSGVKEHFD